MLKVVLINSKKFLCNDVALLSSYAVARRLHLISIESSKRPYLYQQLMVTQSHDQRKRYSIQQNVSDFGINWVRPEKIPSWKPNRAGDLQPYKPPDKSRPTIKYQKIADKLKQADEKVQKVLSLEFSPPRETVKVAKYDVMRKIQRHKYDENSLEVKIARLTMDIRYLQTIMTTRKRDSVQRVHLKEAVDKRWFMLDILRHRDYKCFEWLINELDILYRPKPEQFVTVTRKSSIRKLVSMHCEEIRNKRLEAYRLELKTQQKEFLKEKADTLKWIAETEKSLGVPVSVEVPDEEGQVSPVDLEKKS